MTSRESGTSPILRVRRTTSLENQTVGDKINRQRVVPLTQKGRTTMDRDDSVYVAMWLLCGYCVDAVVDDDDG